MYRDNKRLRHLVSSPSLVDDNTVSTPCENLGTRIRNQMYNGVDSSNSTLLTGKYDDDDDWNVDPLCDMHSDLSSLSLVEHLPTETSE